MQNHARIIHARMAQMLRIGIASAIRVHFDAVLPHWKGAAMTLVRWIESHTLCPVPLVRSSVPGAVLTQDVVKRSSGMALHTLSCPGRHGIPNLGGAFWRGWNHTSGVASLVFEDRLSMDLSRSPIVRDGNRIG